MNAQVLSRRTVLARAATTLGAAVSMPALATPLEAGADAELLRRAAQALVAWDAFEACVEKWCDVIDIPDHVYAEQLRLSSIAGDLRSQALAIPAHTLDGFRAKARLVMTTLETRQDGSMAPDREGYPAWSLCQDLLAKGA
ncbi:hypothetical protein [Acetobacter aceti]|uniref:Twin-arginine translocation pathway signal n=1 Tax=Acetobacter aceti TaxID=435 RepID=A0A6S6PDZ7_ACEAC|nr:hypothetical protein [Acetobacter aceti]BCI65489.1 hypothetical protein AAJCM20276_01130 [Acetobacter aceti]